jgi:ElaB/YqjD/DUF883 family membrane-anchored ribosome-binding protein
MAEERNLGLARATDSPADTDDTKAELQRRMEEARESISQTVTEIKDTVVNQYQQVRESISDTLDWREQFRRRPVPFTIGAAGIGFLLGYGIMSAFKGDGEEDEAFDRVEDGFDRMQQPARSYAASPITGQHATGAYQRASAPGSNAPTEGVFGDSVESKAGGHEIGNRDVGPETRPSYSSGYKAATAPQGLVSRPESSPSASEEEEESKGPGLFERFKETKAYDRLQDELSTIGERVVDELSRTAQAVVVPMLLNKLKSLIGVDLSSQQGGSSQRAQATQSAPQSQTHQTAQPNTPPSSSAGTSSTGQGASGTGGTSARAASGGTEGYGAS